jgi:hypothetical protein
MIPFSSNFTFASSIKTGGVLLISGDSIKGTILEHSQVPTTGSLLVVQENRNPARKSNGIFTMVFFIHSVMVY